MFYSVLLLILQLLAFIFDCYMNRVFHIGINTSHTYQKCPSCKKIKDKQVHNLKVIFLYFFNNLILKLIDNQALVCDWSYSVSYKILFFCIDLKVNSPRTLHSQKFTLLVSSQYQVPHAMLFEVEKIITPTELRLLLNKIFIVF